MLNISRFGRMFFLTVALGLLWQAGACADLSDLPFHDDFDDYANSTPLVEGTNGWFASSDAVVVQSNQYASWPQAAMIPTDCVLSNRFNAADPTNVWIQLDMRPTFYNGTNFPVADTNATVMFYVNSTGGFVVLDGPVTEDTTNWVVTTQGGIDPSVPAWVRINIYQDFDNTNWSLYANGALVTNDIGFVSNKTSFMGFDIYSGAYTSYIDNVSITASETNDAKYPLIVVPSLFKQNLFLGADAVPQTAQVINVWGVDVGFEAATNQEWLSADVMDGVLAAGTTQEVVLTPASTAGWPAGVSNALYAVWSTNGSGDAWATQTVNFVINMIDIDEAMQITPTLLSNDVWIGSTPTQRTLQVWNNGDLAFVYSVATNQAWLSASTTGGALSAWSTQTVTLTYADTTGWTEGLSNAAVTVATTDGAGATQTVAVALNMQDLSAAFEVTPVLLSNDVWIGSTPTQRTFEVRNNGEIDFVYSVGSDQAWLTASTTGGVLAAQSTQTVTLTYADTTGWAEGLSNAVVEVATVNGVGATQDVAVALNMLAMSGVLEVTPLALSNDVWVGDTPTQRMFEVKNNSDADFVYSVATNQAWLSASTTGGLLVARGTEVVTLDFANTLGWAAGLSNAAVEVATADGAGALETVAVALNVVEFDTGVLVVVPDGITNMVGAGTTPANRTFKVINTGAVNLAWTVTITNEEWLNSSSASGEALPNSTNVLTLSFVNTEGWVAGSESNTTLQVATENGFGATGTVWVTLSVLGSGEINTIPYTDDFEAYSDQMALVGGVSGWYGSASSVMVQEEVVRSGTKAAMVPTDSVLSNLFAGPAATGVWVRMDIWPSLYDGTNSPVVDTNVASLFYVNSDGNFVMHNGPTLDPTNSANWVTNTVVDVRNTNWVRVVVCQDWVAKKWALYADDVLVTNGLDFVKPDLTQFSGFDIYSGAGTTYLDNVSVTEPELVLEPLFITNAVWVGETPTQQTFEVRNLGEGPLSYWATNDAAWLGLSTNAGQLETLATNTLGLIYANTADWTAGDSNATVLVGATDATGLTQELAVVVLARDIGDAFAVEPLLLSNDVWIGETPAPQGFVVSNASDLLGFDYTVETGAFWLASSASAGALDPNEPNNLTLTYANTLGWTEGLSSSWARVATTNGIGATTDVAVLVNALDITAALEVTPLLLSNDVWIGETPTQRTFEVRNNAGIDLVYSVAASEAWLSASTTGGVLLAQSTQTVTLTYGPTTGWVEGLSNAVARVATVNGVGATQDVAVALNALDFNGVMQVAPTDLTNTVFIGDTPSNQVFNVWNTGTISFAYNVAIADAWVGCATTSAVLAANTTNELTLVYSNTAGWTAGTSNTTVTLTSSNGVGATNVVNLTLIVESPPSAYFVSLDGGHIAPYTNWAMAATSINAAVDLANTYDFSSTVWVSNGVYDLAATVSITNRVAVQSLAGAGSVMVNGDNTVRGFHLAHADALVKGFAITNCNAGVDFDANGGAAYIEAGLMDNCYLLWNNTTNSGGGAALGAGGTLRNSLIFGNSATNGGGGVLFVGGGLVENCTIVNNLALTNGFGVFVGDATTGMCVNAIVYDNFGSNWSVSAGQQLIFSNSCVSPTNGLAGSGNTTNDPAFIDLVGGNFRVDTNSPCYNTGLNQAWMIGAEDLDGSPRLIGPNVDMGAFENPMCWTLDSVALSNKVMLGLTPGAQTFRIINLGTNVIDFTVTTNAAWIMADTNAGTLGGHATNPVEITYASTAGWDVGTSNTTVTVVITCGLSGLYPDQTQTVAVALDVMEMLVAPTGLTNAVMIGRTPAAQAFDLANNGAGLFNYTIETDAVWVTPVPDSGSRGAYVTNPVGLTYASTAGWQPATSNAILQVKSSDGGGATQTVMVVMKVMDLLVDPGALTNEVNIGYTPVAQSFVISNPGTEPLTYTLATNASWISCADPAGGILAAPGMSTITVHYANTAGWNPGVSNGLITVASTNGGGKTQTVAVVLYVGQIDPPTGVTASDATFADKVLVSWHAAPNATGYQVWRHTVNVSAGATNIGLTAGLAYNDVTAEPGLLYYYWVKSTNNLGVSAFSASDAGVRNLSAPGGVTASDGSYTSKVAVAWHALPHALGYEVWRHHTSNSNAAQKISGAELALPHYDDTTATPGVTYYYWIKASGVAGCLSVFSAPATGWRALAVAGFRVSRGLRHEIRVEWNASSGATRYELLRNIHDDIHGAQLMAGGSMTSYRDLAVRPAVHYYYWLKAICALGETAVGPEIGWCGGRKWDFNGDGRADPWYYSKDSARWYVVPASNHVGTMVFGMPGMDTALADYDGDGKADPAVYDEATGLWMVMLSGSSYAVVRLERFGAPGYVPHPADYDGDGKADPCVYAEATGTWRVLLSASGYAEASASGFGSPGYYAVPADYDGDGKTDPAVYQESSGNWLIMLSGSHYTAQHVVFGAPGYTAVPAEYNGLGYAEIAVYHRASSTWFVKVGNQAQSIQVGSAGQTPIPADYDGDGYDDEALFQRSRRDATWFLHKSTEGDQVISGRNVRP